MKSAKDDVRKILESLPDNATLEDIQYHIYVKEKVENGLNDMTAGKIISQDEAEKRMQKWLER